MLLRQIFFSCFAGFCSGRLGLLKLLPEFSAFPRLLLTKPVDLGFPGGSVIKKICLPTQEMQKMLVRSLGQEDPLEEEMATHSSILAWKIPWTEEPGGL